MKENLGTHLRDNHAYTLSGDFELFWTLQNLGQTKAEKVALFSNFLEIKFKSRLDAHLRGTHISTNFKLFRHLVKVGQTKF